MTDSPLNWKFWLPVELGTLAVGIAIGTFVGSIYMTSGIVPTVATGMMISFTVGGFAGWLDTKRQVIKATWFAGVILAVAVWAGALNLGIAASLAPIALWQAFLPEQSPPWEQICQVLGAIGGVAGGTITGMVLIRQQAAMARAGATESSTTAESGTSVPAPPGTAVSAAPTGPDLAGPDLLEPEADLAESHAVEASHGGGTPGMDAVGANAVGANAAGANSAGANFAGANSAGANNDDSP